jgi:hypothetical protein
VLLLPNKVVVVLKKEHYGSHFIFVDATELTFKIYRAIYLAWWFGVVRYWHWHSHWRPRRCTLYLSELVCTYAKYRYFYSTIVGPFFISMVSLMSLLRRSLARRGGHISTNLHTLLSCAQSLLVIKNNCVHVLFACLLFLCSALHCIALHGDLLVWYGANAGFRLY